MFYFNNTCFICLKHSYNLTFIKFQDTNGTSLKDKLKYFLPEFELNPNTPKYICTECGFNLNKCYEFKQICLRNITTYEKYAQQITTTDSSNKYLSVGAEKIFKVNNYLKNNLELCESIVKEEINEELPEYLFVDCNAKISDENNYDTNISEAQSEINEDLILKEEINEKLVLESKTGNENKCKICNKLFKCARYLTIHNFIHTGKKPHTCDVCNKSFHRLDILKKHHLVHTEDKQFTCEVCNTSFRYFYLLKSHKLLHTGEKPFTCEVCNKSFRHSNTLKSHRLIHTGEKPLTCEVCNESFRHFQVFKKHKLLHNG